MAMALILSEIEKVKSLTKFDENGKAVKYKHFDILSWHQCPKHGTQPATYGEVFGEIRDEWNFPYRCMECAKQEAIDNAVAEASVPLRYLNKTLESYERDTNERKKVFAAVKEYVETMNDSLANGRCLIMVGGVGTGKTHLACGLVREVVSSGRAAKFTTVQKLIREVRASWGTKTEQAVIDEFAKLDLLVIDEVGVQAGSENERNILFDIVNSRYEDMRSTVIITNCDIDGIKAYLGERVVDRLRENGGRLVQFTGKSYRG